MYLECLSQATPFSWSPIRSDHSVANARDTVHSGTYGRPHFEINDYSLRLSPIIMTLKSNDSHWMATRLASPEYHARDEAQLLADEPAVGEA